MKVVITGASGYIGRHVVDEFVNKGHEVVAVDIRNTGINPKAQFIDESIFDDDPKICEKLGNPELCVHMAWQDGFVHNAPSHMENLSAHCRFLRYMIEGGCKNIAVMSSMHEIGFWEGVIDENTPCKPLSLYGIAKNAIREALFLYAKDKDVNIYWLRGFYILGDDLNNHSIFTKILQAANEGKKTFPFTTGTAKYDFITVDEMSNQICAVTTQDKYTGIINICSGEPVALKDKVEEFIREKNLDISLEYGVFPTRPYDSKIIYGDNTIIKAVMADGH